MSDFFPGGYFPLSYFPGVYNGDAGAGDPNRLTGFAIGFATVTGRLTATGQAPAEAWLGSGGGFDVLRRKKRRREESDIMILLMAA